MKRYLLDTNTVSHLLKGHPSVVQRVTTVPMASLCISAITAGELRYGLAKRPAAARLHLAVAELLRRVDVLPWDDGIATRYGSLRADLEQRGKSLSPLDLQIAAHALGLGHVLVSNDRAFRQVAELPVEDWTVAA